jgi:hypothetical protein
MGQWLVEQSPTLGIPFQNWMGLVAVIVLVSVVFSWLTRR